ncbi:hypothetical protein C8F01DRAFT_1367088 [Mycena amicta]|nr:hypothetical protein C8F01DRAFT_1367088 [Mycena amicta]
MSLKAKTSTILSALLAPLWASRCRAILINITVDDTDTTAWTWAGSWNAITRQNPCTVCFAQPDGSRTHNYSWHDGDLLSGSFTFQGVAVYIYGIDVVDPANITFAMSNPPISAFHYKDSGGGYIYNSLFFSASGLDGTSQHTVTWMETLNPIGGGAGLFDYAVVTVDEVEESSPSSARPSLGKSSTRSSSSANIAQPSFGASSTQPSSATSSGAPSSSSPNSTFLVPSTSNSASLTDNTHKSNLKAWPIAGGVIGALVALAILATVLYYCLRRRNHSSVLDIGNKRSWRSHPCNTRSVAIEPFQLSPSSSTITRNPKERAVLGWSPSRLSSPITPAPAHTGDAENVEQRLRHLEAIVADQGPPAYV